MASAGYSIKDLYPDFNNIQSTTDNTVPAEDQQTVYVHADIDSGELVTKKDKHATLFAVIAVIAALFAFGLIK